MIGNSGISGTFRGLPNLDWQITKHASDAFTGASGQHGNITDANTYTLFTVTGDVIIQSFWGIVNTTVTGGTVKVGVPGTLVGLLPDRTTGTLTDGSVYINSGSTFGIGDTSGNHLKAINDGADIVETTLTGNMISGQIDYYCIWAPAEAGASIVSAGTLAQV